jgi:hypothetical protein
MIVPRQHVMVLVDAKLETVYDHGGRWGISFWALDHKRNNKFVVNAGEVQVSKRDLVFLAYTIPIGFASYSKAINPANRALERSLSAGNGDEHGD